MSAIVDRHPVYVTETEVLQTEPATGEYIAVKRKLSVGDRAQLRDLVEIAVGDGKREVSYGTLRAGRMIRELMRLSIVGWRLYDESTPPALVPFTEAAIDELDEEAPIVDRALTEIARLNPIQARG